MHFKHVPRKICNFDPVILDFIVTCWHNNPQVQGWRSFIESANKGPNPKWNLNYQKYTNLIFLARSLKPAVPYFAAFPICKNSALNYWSSWFTSPYIQRYLINYIFIHINSRLYYLISILLFIIFFQNHLSILRVEYDIACWFI